MIQIKKILGLDIKYDEQSERFYLFDADGTQIGSESTQAGVEKQAKSHSKQKFIRVAIIGFDSFDQAVLKGELTSYNADDESAWVSMGKDKGGFGSGRQKINLRHKYGTTSYYEATEKNLKLAAEIEAKGKAAKAMEREAVALRKHLEKGINNEYFGIKEGLTA